MSWLLILVIVFLFIIMLVAWGAIISNAGYNGALAILLLIPIVNFIFFIYFAFTIWPNMKIRVCTKCNKRFAVDELFCTKCGEETSLFILPCDSDIKESDKNQMLEIGKRSFPVLAAFDEIQKKMEKLDVRLDKSELVKFDPLLDQLEKLIEKGEVGWHTDAGEEIRGSLAKLLLEKGNKFSSHIGNKEKAIELYNLALKIVNSAETKENIRIAIREANGQCIRCGKKINDGQEYCAGCGSKTS